MHRLKKNGDGNSFTNDSTVKEIATAVIGTFDGLPSKVSRVESIARELQAWSRRRQNWSPHRRRLRARRGAADHEHHEPPRTTRGTVLFLFFGTSPTSQTKARFRKDIPIGSSDQYGRDAGHANRGYPKAVHD